MVEEEFEKTEENKSKSDEENTDFKIRKPKNGEILGIIVQGLGGNRMEVRCVDGKIRNCRVPGRFKRSMWLKPKDIVIVEPWEFDNDKADVVFKYSPNAVHQLRKKGMLDNIKEDF